MVQINFLHLSLKNNIKNNNNNNNMFSQKTGNLNQKHQQYTKQHAQHRLSTISYGQIAVVVILESTCLYLGTELQLTRDY